MIQPESRIKNYWDLAVLAAIIGTAIVIPVVVVFEDTCGRAPGGR